MTMEQKGQSEPTESADAFRPFVAVIIRDNPLIVLNWVCTYKYHIEYVIQTPSFGSKINISHKVR